METQAALAAPPPSAVFMNAPPTHEAASKRFFSILNDTERFLHEIKPPSLSNVAFRVYDIPFKARHDQAPGGAVLLIWGILGYLPYSVHSPAKRKDLITILEGTHGLKNVKFGVDRHMQIVVTGEYKIAKPLTPDYLFVPLVRFMEEALPFIRLIGSYL